MNGNSVIRFDLSFTSTEDSISNINQPMRMSVMDSGYGPNTVQYNSSKFPYNEPFVQSLELKNIHFLSQNSTYMIRFSRAIRYMASPGDFGSFIGIRPRYFEIPYVKSNIGPGIFSPWGYVQKRIISKEGLTYTAESLASLEKYSLEERVRRLEALDMFLNDHVIGIPFDRDVK
ncbi:hypothetical protein C2G38_2032065 [Gigaspora rosea]|uniref:Uncharacterized protein n=1 Tax=Gigaspora rosea TaxID=44941 RepID=A0A397VP05_9GLOM|nr:hypothetical protein C2G38_2032065 [Gigaspora rosea]